MPRLLSLPPAAVAAALALVVASANARAEDLVVIESTLAAYPPGSTLAGGKPVKMPANSRLVLVSEGGRTIALSGPYDGTPAPAGATAGGASRLTNALATLVRTSGEDAHSVGAIRAASIRTREDALRINLSESGDYCVADAKAVEVTRYASERGDDVVINAVKGDVKAGFRWPSGGHNAPWPAALALEDEGTYLVEQAGKDSRTMILIHRIEDKAPTDAHRAVLMAEKGCMEQAKMLLALLKRG